jgi:hypothetical protein
MLGISKQLSKFLNRIVKLKYPEINELLVRGRDIGNDNFDYTIWIHPTWEGADRLNSDENFEEELFKYIENTTKSVIDMLMLPNRGHYFNKVDWFWE